MKKAILFVMMMGLASAAWAVDDEANKKILKDAIVGAVTGAVAVEATKEDAPPAVAAAVEAPDSERHHHHDKKHRPKKNFHEKKKKDKKRPHGWDIGKKTGWGDSNVPPGLKDKDR